MPSASTTARSQPSSGRPMRTGPGPPSAGRAGHHRGLRGAVGVPDLAAFHGQALGKLRRAGLAAEDQQPDVFEGLRRPERSQRGNGGHHRDAVADEPRARGPCRCGPGPAARGPGRRRAARRATSPRRRRQRPRTVRPAPCPAGRRVPPARKIRGLGVDEGGGGPVPDGHALRRSGGAGREDDPGVVVGRWQAVAAGNGAARVFGQCQAVAGDRRPRPWLHRRPAGPVRRGRRRRRGHTPHRCAG